MPYEIKRVGTYYSVVNKLTGRKFSEHSTESNAKQQLALLESKDKANIKPLRSRVVKYGSRR